MRAPRVIAWALLALSLDSAACSCFPPEVRAKTARDALASARVAALARPMAVDAQGRVRLVVTESFKGPSVGSVLESSVDVVRCPTPPAPPTDVVLVLAFGEAVTGCDFHSREHYLIEQLRSVPPHPPQPPQPPQPRQ